MLRPVYDLCTCPPWARCVAAAVLWTSMPSALCRFAVVTGVPLGLAGPEYDAMPLPGPGVAHALDRTEDS
ncbi:hypothetical protein B7767_11055 [Streptomyces sp. 13-12-16]|nr:hypothetical protein B7767_11055 [Streptomyces sp. 13-12-16]